MASTKPGSEALTYAQNLCCGAAKIRVRDILRYQSNSAAKLLIYIDSLNCFFSGHSKQSLDLQGLRMNADKLSTKLSTENLEICKAPLNQALRRLSVSTFTDLTTNVYFS